MSTEVLNQGEKTKVFAPGASESTDDWRKKDLVNWARDAVPIFLCGIVFLSDLFNINKY